MDLNLDHPASPQHLVPFTSTSKVGEEEEGCSTYPAPLSIRSPAPSPLPPPLCPL